MADCSSERLHTGSLVAVSTARGGHAVKSATSASKPSTASCREWRGMIPGSVQDVSSKKMKVAIMTRMVRHTKSLDTTHKYGEHTAK